MVRKHYKKRGARPTAAADRMTILLEPSLGVRLRWLAEQNGESYTALVEKILESSRELAHEVPQ